ncbi:hypothetical protein OUY22_28905 [Nonomuraea sp. MCN248]|uniref:Nuclear transport factor 2 family protein n=1 Tax=Nonomuraea corallina TaxID=2989783 RepID=A0ABT4SJZ3_9ACTN|nr:hypothetical protein [Nonomuraea corallina]MDA0637444.1 hypothetical protein [Nonomuraea corallina]
MDPRPPSPAPPRPSLTSWLVAGALIALAVCAAVVFAALSRTGPDPTGAATENPEEARIRTTVETFAHAVDREDTAAMIGLLCEEEAEGVTRRSPRPGLGPAHERPVEVTDVHVTGDVATARVTRPAQQPATLYLRREAGVWKLCDPERYRDATPDSGG